MSSLNTSAAGDEDDDGPAVIRPAISRSGSTKLKKKGSSSRLSFGVTEDAGDTQPFTPKKNPSTSLSQRATENSALRASLSSRSLNLPTRSFGAEQEQPMYSREYLEELQSSTPNTTQNPDKSRVPDDGDAMELDASELEGAVVVPAADLSVSTTLGEPGHIPSAAEIREKKERRARLAKEGDAYKDDEYAEEDGFISLAPKKKKDDTRLIAEDEDLGEGYDEYVEDGRLELGKRGEKEARRRHRREMEELINAAEGASEEDDSDSDAERKAAYEAAQTRAAMDGLHRAAAAAAAEDADPGARLVIPKMKPLPELGVSLARMRELVREMEEQVALKKRRIEGIEKEKQEILDREKEVQEVLNRAGMKYQSAIGIKSETVLDPETLAAQSPLRNTQIRPEERGLESFGTPTRKAEEDGPEEMEE